MFIIRKKYYFGAILIATCLSSNAQFFFFPIPLPNTGTPQQLTQLIEALERSNDTKAVATVSEDKTFGSKYWNWGYVSGEMSQEHADRIALASCTINLDQMKSQSAGGKPLYDFGKKKCELHVFKNKSLKSPSAGKIKISSSDANYLKIQIIEKFKSFEVGGDWENSLLSSEQKSAGTVFMSVNNKLGVGFKVEVGAKSSAQDFRSSVESIRNSRRSANTLEDFKLSQTSQTTVNDRLAYQYTWSGKLKTNRNFEFTYYDVVVDLGDALELLTFWSQSNSYDSNKNEFDALSQKLISFSTDENFKNNFKESAPSVIIDSIKVNEKKDRITVNFGEDWVNENITDGLKNSGVIIFKVNHALGAAVIISSTKTSYIKDIQQYIATTSSGLESILKNPQKSDTKIVEINGSHFARYETWGTQLINGTSHEIKYLTYIVVDKEEIFVIRFNTLIYNFDFQKSIFEEKMNSIIIRDPQKISFNFKRDRSGLTSNQIKQQCINLGFSEGSDEYSACLKEILSREK
jgi:hypothetical protein